MRRVQYDSRSAGSSSRVRSPARTVTDVSVTSWARELVSCSSYARWILPSVAGTGIGAATTLATNGVATDGVVSGLGAAVAGVVIDVVLGGGVSFGCEQAAISAATPRTATVARARGGIRRSYRVISLATPRQPSNSSAVTRDATTTKLADTPADVALRNSIPTTTVHSHTATPVGTSAIGLRQPRASSQPAPAPARNGHAVSATPVMVTPSA